MHLELSEEHECLRQTVRSFAEKEIRPRAAEIDRERRFPVENVHQCAEMNFMGVSVPREYGGGGLDRLSYCIVIEELSRVCASTGVIVSVNNSLVCAPLHVFGSEQQKRQYLEPLARGERLGCFALTEPGAGSDAAGLQARAERHGDHYILRGSKVFVTNGVAADTALVFASTDPDKKHRGISAFIVERNFPGFNAGREDRMLGVTASGSLEIVLDGCRVPAANLLGSEGEGWRIALSALDNGRVGIAAQAVGLAQGVLDEAVRYSQQRVQFGKPISDFQAIQWMISDIATETEAARMLTYRAAWAQQHQERFTYEASMAKLFASEAAMRAATKGVQILGGYGYLSDYPMERFFRDAKATEIYEGTSEIQRLLIAEHLLVE
ncbi:MAG: acyl-CoA dehydrogenase [Acidobacteriota bacterium]